MSIAVFLDVSPSFFNEAKYAIDNILFPVEANLFFVSSITELESHAVRVIYCGEQSDTFSQRARYPETIFIIQEEWTLQYFATFQEYNPESIQIVDDLPMLFPWQKESQANILPFDLVAAAYFFLSCWQEYCIEERDWKGRVPLYRTLQHKLDITQRPVVTEYLQFFLDFAAGVSGNSLGLKKLPGGGDLFVALSHDIDYIDWSLRKYIQYLVQERHILSLRGEGLVGFLRNMAGRKYVFSEMKKAEMLVGAASSYFFLSEYQTAGHKKYAKKLIDSLAGTAFEVGHHIAGDAIFDKTLEKDVKHFLPQVRKLHGGRVHTLRFEVDQLFRQLEESEYCYDNSLLFAEEPGYRTGFSYPHYVFDIEEKRAFDVVAIPLNMMDGTFTDAKYLNLSDDDAEQEMRWFVDNAVTHGGFLSVLFHNNFFFINTAGRLKLYKRLLRFFTENNIKIGCCREVYLWRKG